MLSKKLFQWPNIILFMSAVCVFSASCAMIEKGGVDDSAGPIQHQDNDAFIATGREVPKPGETAPPLVPEGPLKVTIEDAILIALENNRSLVVERFNPSIRRTVEDQQTAVFDPVFTGGAEYFYEKNQQRRSDIPIVPDNRLQESGIGIGVSKFFSTGTDVDVDLSTDYTDTNTLGDLYQTRLGLTVTQALLRGAGADVNLARLRQARLDTRASQYELRGFAEALLAQVEEAYWDYALSQRQIEIFQESLKIAGQQVRETEDMIKVGKMAESELAAVQAEMALRRQDLIDARSAMAKARLRLLRLLNPPGSNIWEREISLLYEPVLPEVKLDQVETHAKLALRMRPDLNQARLELQREELEIVRTKNGLLPQMDLFIRLGKTGYADSFGGSVSDITGDSYDVTGGISFEYPFGNRDARASYRRSSILRNQAEASVENLAQLVELDVQSAYIEVNRSKEQIAATKSVRRLQEEKLRIETEKFRVGRSTSFLVAQAQRDLVSSRISEVQAVVTYLKALVDFFRLEGSLLERRGITAPGREPTTPSLKKQ